MAFERCEICGKRSAHVVESPARFQDRAGSFVNLPTDRHMKCDSCGETYYTGAQWIQTDLALQGRLEYVVGSVTARDSGGPVLVATETGTLSAAVFFQPGVSGVSYPSASSVSSAQRKHVTIPKVPIYAW